MPESALTLQTLDPVLGRVLPEALATIHAQQLPTGEIPSLQRDGQNTLLYRRTPFLSTFVYDALGLFDPRSPWFDPQILYLVPPAYHAWFLRLVIAIRRRIAAYVAWEESSDGCWRFFGNGSGIDPDSDTTACAAAVLLEEGRGRRPPDHHVRALRRFQSPEGTFFSYVHRDGRGYSWMDADGRPIVGFDRVVNANVLRFLALAGQDTTAIACYLLRELDEGDGAVGSPDYPNPLCFFHAVTRAWQQSCLPDGSVISSFLIPHIVRLDVTRSDVGGSLSCALALATLLNLQHTGHITTQIAAMLLDRRQPGGGWEHEDFFVHGYGSAAWTTALAMSVLARHALAARAP